MLPLWVEPVAKFFANRNSERDALEKKRFELMRDYAARMGGETAELDAAKFNADRQKGSSLPQIAFGVADLVDQNNERKKREKREAEEEARRERERYGSRDEREYRSGGSGSGGYAGSLSLKDIY